MSDDLLSDHVKEAQEKIINEQRKISEEYPLDKYISSLRDKAIEYHDQNHFFAARLLLSECISKLKEIPNRNARLEKQYIITLDYFGRMYGDYGYYSSAETFMKNALDGIKKFSPKPDELNPYIYRLAKIQRRLGKFEDAIKNLQEAYLMQYAFLEFRLKARLEHKETLKNLCTFLHDLAANYQELKDFTRSKELLLKGIEKFEYFSLTDNSGYYALKNDLATIFYAEKKYHDALNLFNDVIHNYDNFIKNDLSYYVHILKNVGLTLDALNLESDKIKLYESGIKKLEKLDKEYDSIPDSQKGGLYLAIAEIKKITVSSFCKKTKPFSC